MTTREGSAASAALPRADAVSTGGTYRAALQTLGNATFSAAPQRPRDAFDLIAGPPREHRATILRVLEIVNSVSYRRSVAFEGANAHRVTRPRRPRPNASRPISWCRLSWQTVESDVSRPSCCLDGQGSRVNFRPQNHGAVSRDACDHIDFATAKMVNGMPRICWHTIFYLWETTVARQAIEKAWNLCLLRRTFVELLVPAASPLSRHGD